MCDCVCVCYDITSVCYDITSVRWLTRAEFSPLSSDLKALRRGQQP